MKKSFTIRALLEFCKAFQSSKSISSISQIRITFKMIVEIELSVEEFIKEETKTGGIKVNHCIT